MYLMIMKKADQDTHTYVLCNHRLLDYVDLKAKNLFHQLQLCTTIYNYVQLHTDNYLDSTFVYPDLQCFKN